MPKEDEELLVLYQETEDPAHLGELFDRYVHLVYGVCLKYLRNNEDSKDMTMHVFEKLSIQLKKQEIKNFKSWLHVLTKNECLMLLRTLRYKIEKENKGINPETDMDLSYIMHPKEEDQLENSLQELEIAMEELPFEQKACIRLFYIQQKCYKEIVA
ncbi:MAG: sigma-70 family RNA polymerase sigma factor, partial [Bacteroidota bacterium]|nr:sigma-70 family RNA polymerase sigma factor [Bacteroidota bacterium]